MSETPVSSVQPAAEPAAPGPDRKPPAWQFWRRPKKPKRPLLMRLFGLSVWGTVKLVLICILVGFVMLAMQFNPADPGFDATNAVAELWQNTVATARWAVINFWKPALTGASVVLPIWVLWRLATLPFRK